MTQKKLLNKAPINLFLFTLRKNLGISLISSAIVLVFSPFLVLQTVNNYLKYDFNYYYPFKDVYEFGGPLLAIAATLVFILLLFINFSYLYNKSASDTFHSLPIKRYELLVSRFFGAYISSLIPLLAGYIGFAIVLAKSEVVGSYATILSGFLFTALAMIFCGAFTLIFIISAGNVFDAVVSFLSVNIGLPIILLVIYECLGDQLFGYLGGFRSGIIYCTPFIYSAYSIFQFGSYPENFTLFTLPGVIICTLITVLFAAACVLLYNRRKSEKVSSPYAFGFMPFIIGIIVSVIAYIIFALIFDSFGFEIVSVGGIIGALIGSIIYNAVTNRGFKKIKSSFIVAGVSVLLVIAVTLSIELDIFGYETYVPKNEEIVNTEIRYQGYGMTIDNPEIITALHKQVIEAHEAEIDGECYGECEYFTVTYLLKSGKQVMRGYDIPMGVARAQKQRIINEYLPKTITDEFLSTKSQNFIFNGTGKYSGKEQNFSVILTRSEVQSFVNAYCEDLSKVQYDAHWNTDSIEADYNISHINTVNDEDTDYYNLNILVRKDFTKTKEFINSIDIEARNTVDTEMELYDQ